MSTGAQLRDAGQDAVIAADTAAHRGYAALVAEGVDHLAGLPFTAEDVRSHIEDRHPDARPHHPNVIGATLGGMANAGRIRAVGYRQSTRPTSRCRVLRVWQVTPQAPSGGRSTAPTPAPPGSPTG